jgi:CDP-2,3-bis-(O-geranylgeranyl)-sn-glycerol synthase
MEIALLVVDALKFIFPAYCANAAPVLGGGGKPMDFGRNFFDGKRILGAHKTFRGFFVGLAIGTLVGVMDCLVFGFPWLFAVLTPLGALVGDLAGAFLKRRLKPCSLRLLPVWIKLTLLLGL